MALIGKKTESVPTGLALVMGNVNPLSNPRMRMLVRSAVTEGDYEAVQGAHVLAKSLAPARSEMWTWWVDGVESLARGGDKDLELFVRFTATSPASPPGAISRRPPASG